LPDFSQIQEIQPDLSGTIDFQFKKKIRRDYFLENDFAHKINLKLTVIKLKYAIINLNCQTIAPLPQLGFLKHLYTAETINLKFFQESQGPS